MKKQKKNRKSSQPSIKKIERLEISPRWQLALAATLFIVCAALVHNRSMSAAEIAIFKGIYNLPPVFAGFFSVFTHLGNIYILLGLSLLLLAKQYYHMTVRLLFVGSLAYLFTGVMKDLIGRGRPAEYIPDLVYKDIAVRGSSFPSGHMALATALLLTISLYLPAKYKWIAPVGIVLAGLSRINLGVHGPMDIIGGFAIGWAAVALFKFVEIRLTKNPKNG